METASILKFTGKDSKPRTGAVKAFDGCLDGTLTGKPSTVVGIIDTPENRAKLTADHGETEASNIIAGAIALAGHYQAGKEVSVTSIIRQVAAKNAQFSYRLLTDKSKILLIDSGVLVQINATKYQWNELTTCNGTALTCNSPAMGGEKPAIDYLQWLEYLSPQQWADWCTLYLAKRSPWCEVKADGSIQKIRKPFTGELTAQEKQAKRESAEKAYYAKLLGNNSQLTPDAAKLAEQKQLEMIERRASQQAQMDTFWMWAKVLGFLALVFFAISSVNTGSQPVDNMPQGVYMGNAQ